MISTEISCCEYVSEFMIFFLLQCVYVSLGCVVRGLFKDLCVSRTHLCCVLYSTGLVGFTKAH